ncbi:Hypothetical predicted protein, partial [Paramuricea clavata]
TMISSFRSCLQVCQLLQPGSQKLLLLPPNDSPNPEENAAQTLSILDRLLWLK